MMLEVDEDVLVHISGVVSTSSKHKILLGSC